MSSLASAGFTFAMQNALTIRDVTRYLYGAFCESIKFAEIESSGS